jgi:outer membrane lipoprotein-sorting protein
MRNLLRLAAIFVLPCFLLFAQESAPESIVGRFEGVVARIEDYRCRVREWCYNGNDYEQRLLDFYFKKPRFIRADIIEGNRLFDPGSVAVYSGSDTVTGKKGGILSGIVFTLDKKDPLATSIRGTTIDETDLVGIAKAFRRYLEESICTVDVLADGTIRLTEMEKPAPRGEKGSREVLYLDGTSFLPIKMEGFEGDRQVVFIEWSDYVVNGGLPEALFDVSFDSRSLKKADAK